MRGIFREGGVVKQFIGWRALVKNPNKDDPPSFVVPAVFLHHCLTASTRRIVHRIGLNHLVAYSWQSADLAPDPLDDKH